MDKIVEEVLTGLIKRIEFLEEKVLTGIIMKKVISKGCPIPSERKPGMISQGQIDFIVGLVKELGCEGQVDYEKMTMKQASDYIEDLKERKESHIAFKGEPSHRELSIEAAMDPNVIDTSRKPLTKEEIKELEKEGALL